MSCPNSAAPRPPQPAAAASISGAQAGIRRCLRTAPGSGGPVTVAGRGEAGIAVTARSYSITAASRTSAAVDRLRRQRTRVRPTNRGAARGRVHWASGT
jgi:hypothetical protein